LYNKYNNHNVSLIRNSITITIIVTMEWYLQTLNKIR